MTGGERQTRNWKGQALADLKVAATQSGKTKLEKVASDEWREGKN
jgi:hypothetical protein